MCECTACGGRLGWPTYCFCCLCADVLGVGEEVEDQVRVRDTLLHSWLPDARQHRLGRSTSSAGSTSASTSVVLAREWRSCAKGAELSHNAVCLLQIRHSKLAAHAVAPDTHTSK